MPDDFETLIHEGIFNDPELRNRLLELAQNRLLGLTRKMFHQFPDFHQAVECLPRDEQEIVNLLFYDGLTQAQASEALGMPLRSLKRKWALVKVKLQKALENDE
jgi:DNA-directed RNA polymerase specialized sigma24 family protein